jgi:hypothetical protein
LASHFSLLLKFSSDEILFAEASKSFTLDAAAIVVADWNLKP